MKILGLRTINGPNVYHSQPVLVMKVDLGTWTDIGSHELPNFTSKLLSLLPGLNQHTCSPGYIGGFRERLERGTYMAHIIEHVAIELSGLAEMPVNYGKTRYAGDPGQYNIVVRFLNEEGMKACLRSAFQLVNSILLQRGFELHEALTEINKIVSRTALGPSGKALYEAAVRRNIPVRRLTQNSLLQLGYGKYRRRLQAAVSDQTGLIASELVQDKDATKSMLAENGIAVPEGEVIRTDLELRSAMQTVRGPYAVKPCDGHHGQGVSLNLRTEAEVAKAFYIAKEFAPEVIIEEMCIGKDFRVLVIGGKFSAASERIPPAVTGDGISTIRQLIDRMNRDPKRGEGHSCVLTQITVDELLLENLRKQNLQMESVPVQGQKIILKENANLSSGGTAVDVTSEVHSEIRSVCERISRIVDLDICGIDVIAQSLSVPLAHSHMKVIEVNAGPGLRMHLAPSTGAARNVADDILQMLYPEGSPSRIPIAAVTGTNGKTTTVRLMHKILSQSSCVGLTTSDGVFIGNDQIQTGDTTGPHSARMVLADPAVEKAVLEVARGGLLRGGLAYDWSDVGVITNIRPDHIGQDGIEDIEDLVWIKSLVAERVRENGVLVLNADDEQSLKIRSRPNIQKIPRKFILYSISEKNQELNSHLQKGGDGCWLKDGWIYVQENKTARRLMAVQELSFTMAGLAQFQVSNALAAVAASRSMGASWDQIVSGMRNFASTSENRGRLNLYQVGEGYLILDYGHNPDAITAMGEMLAQWKGYLKTAVFGLPGDRADHILEMSAEKVAQYFDHLILRDDLDLRGREPGEIPQLVATFVQEKFPQVRCRKILDEHEALKCALDQLQKNEIVVVFYDEFPAVMQVLRQYDPVPISMIPFRDLSASSNSEELFEEEIIGSRTYSSSSFQ
jgi:cyanophycin synthetase